jgi:tRNA G37 N-methylase Trm5
MKFETKFGIGEICIHDPFAGRDKESSPPRDLLVKVVAIQINNAAITYICENILTNGHVEYINCHEKDLIGDPEFDQEKGCYPENSED